MLESQCLEHKELDQVTRRNCEEVTFLFCFPLPEKASIILVSSLSLDFPLLEMRKQWAPIKAAGSGKVCGKKLKRLERLPQSQD